LLPNPKCSFFVVVTLFLGMVKQHYFKDGIITIPDPIWNSLKHNDSNSTNAVFPILATL
jgi:hypothetical protein